MHDNIKGIKEKNSNLDEDLYKSNINNAKI